MNHFLAQKIDEKRGFLNDTDSHHALRVLRLEEGDHLSISYGEGIVYQAKIDLLNKKHCEFTIEKELRIQKKPNLHLAIAPTKSNDRFEWFLEKAVEFGVASIHPLITEHSERKVYKRERGLRVMEAAFKQSHKGFMPELHELRSMEDFLNQALPVNRWVATLAHSSRAKLSELDFKSPLVVLIGPEGDLSARDLKALTQHQFIALDLGSEVLRTETAAMHIASIANYQL